MRSYLLHLMSNLLHIRDVIFCVAMAAKMPEVILTKYSLFKYLKLQKTQMKIFPWDCLDLNSQMATQGVI